MTRLLAFVIGGAARIGQAVTGEISGAIQASPCGGLSENNMEELAARSRALDGYTSGGIRYFAIDAGSDISTLHRNAARLRYVLNCRAQACAERKGPWTLWHN
jgi:hypothetical protein